MTRQVLDHGELAIKFCRYRHRSMRLYFEVPAGVITVDAARRLFF